MSWVFLTLCGCEAPSGRVPVDPSGDDSDLPFDSGLGGATDIDLGDPLEPSVRMVSSPALQISPPYALVRAHAGDPGFVYVSAAYVPYTGAMPLTVGLPGSLPAGDHDLESIWDGVSGITPASPIVVEAGDVNEDAHLDVWVCDELMLGPLEGHSFQRDGDEAVAEIVGIHGGNSGECVVAAEFDADGDQNLDVVTHTAGNQGFVRYGPFTGVMESAAQGVADPATYSSLGLSVGCTEMNLFGTLLRDHLGPGGDVVALGDASLTGCPNDTYLWDPNVPRGTHRDYDDALAFTADSYQFSDAVVSDAGDLDADGYSDFVYHKAGVGILVSGPASGVISHFNFDMESPITLLHGTIARGLEDVNGDGVRDLLGMYVVRSDSAYGILYRRHLVLCSPFSDPLDVATGVLLPTLRRSTSEWIRSADLDGDGKAEIVDFDPGWFVGGEAIELPAFEIWGGAEVAAACEARRVDSR